MTAWPNFIAGCRRHVRRQWPACCSRCCSARRLFSCALTLPEHAEYGTQWVDRRTGDRMQSLAAVLMPFAGIAFLWFIGVVRDGFGRFEDKFFASVFIGSGLLFLAMTFVCDRGRRGVEPATQFAGDPRACRGRGVRSDADD